MKPRILLFRAGDLLCGLPLEDVVETMRPLPIRPLAGLPVYAQGISVVRGQATAVVDVALLLTGAPGPTSRFVAIRDTPTPAVLATGDVLGVADLPDHTTAEPTPHGPHRVAALGVRGDEPILLVRGGTVVPAELWTALSVGAGR